jgi:hypothetical protein
MEKRKTTEENAQLAKVTLAEVTKEMAKPRVAKSARQHRRVFRNEVLVVKNNVEK